MQEPRDEAAAQSATAVRGPPEGGQAPDGLTELHLAVIKNDLAGLRKILSSRERGIDERTSQGATPLMMACLFGRASIFLSLVRKKASTLKKDSNGVGPLGYVKHLPPTEKALGEYRAFTGQKPSHSGRKKIYAILQACIQASRDQRRLAAREPRAEPEVRPAAQAVPADVDEMETVFLREGGKLRIAKARILETVAFKADLGRKSSGAIRAKDESGFGMIAISGWRGDKGEGGPLLDNKTYSALARRICVEYKLKLPANWLDNVWRGDPSEKVGAFASCHAEKQLAAWALEESIFHTMQTREVTRENIANVKLQVDRLPPNLRETVIELDHEPCASCIDFLRLIRDKAGLRIEWKSRKWFTRGTRPKLRCRDGARVTGTRESEETFEDEVDEGSFVVVTDAIAAQDDDEEADIDDDYVAVGSSSLPSPVAGLNGTWETEPPLPPSGGSQRTQRSRGAPETSSLPSGPYSKHASPVLEWPLPPVEYLGKTIRMVSSKRRRVLRATGPARTQRGRNLSQSSPSLPEPASSEALAVVVVDDDDDDDDDDDNLVASRDAPSPGRGSPRPVDFTIPIQLAPRARSPPRELDPAVLDEPVAEPFPGASELRWSFSGQDQA